jgi:PAS domain S-box-containing protein
MGRSAMKRDDLTARVVSRMLVLAALYFVTAKLGLSLEVAQGNATPVWPPTAIALVALLLFGPRLWPGIFLGAFIANATTPIPLWVAGAIAVGNTLEAMIGYRLLRMVDFRASLQRVRDVVALVVLAGGVSTLVSATIGVTSLLVAGQISLDAFGLHWQVWWLGDAMGDILLAPVLLAWASVRRYELDGGAGLLHAIGICAGLVFVGFLFRWEAPSAAYATFPLVMWATLRFRQVGASTSVAIATGFGIAAIVSGSDPFGGTDDTRSVALLQGLMGLGAFASLLVAATLSERDEATAASRREAGLLRDSRRQLAEAQGLAHVGSWAWDIATGAVHWSEEMFRIYGYEPTNDPIDFEAAVRDVVPEDRDLITLNALSAIEAGAEGDLPDVEYRVLRPDGRERVLQGRGRLILDGDGRPKEMVGTVQDITDNREAERNAERLKEMEARHRQALELNDEIVQGLAAAKLALELDERGKAISVLHETMGSARAIVSDLLRRSGIAPGDLIRERPPGSDPERSAPERSDP